MKSRKKGVSIFVLLGLLLIFGMVTIISSIMMLQIGTESSEKASTLSLCAQIQLEIIGANMNPGNVLEVTIKNEGMIENHVKVTAVRVGEVVGESGSERIKSGEIKGISFPVNQTPGWVRAYPEECPSITSTFKVEK